MQRCAKDLAEARKWLIDALHKRSLPAYALASKYGVQVDLSAGRFTLSFMPGNRRTLISHGSFVMPNHRGQGLASLWLLQKMHAAKEAGVTLMLCTVRHDNPVEEHLLVKRGWKEFTRNEETKCSLWGVQL